MFVLLLNVIFVVVSFWLIRRFYSARFDRLAVIVQEAMALRDAEFRKLEAQFASMIIKDTRLLDGALEDYSDVLEAEGEDDEREGTDS